MNAVVNSVSLSFCSKVVALLFLRDNVNYLHAYCAPGLHVFSCKKSCATAVLLDYLGGV